jgi:PAS domain S-box-containing protein
MANEEVPSKRSKIATRLLAGTNKMVDASECPPMATDEHTIVPDLSEYFFNSVDLLSVVARRNAMGFTNPAWETILGWDVASLKESDFIDFVHPDDVERTLRESELEWSSTESERIGFENRLRCRDGSYKWIEWTSRRRDDLIYATGRDVTRRHRVLIQLDEYIEMTRAIFTAATDAILVVDRGLRIVEMSPSGQQIFGVVNGGWIGQIALKIMHPNDHETVKDAIRRIFDFGEIATARFRARHVDGHWMTFEARGQAMESVSGSPTGAVVICRDISKAVAEEAALADSLRKITAIVDTAVDVITIIDRDFNMIELSPPTKPTTDTPMHVPRLQNMLSRIHPDDQVAVIESNRRIFEKGNTETIRYRYLDDDGNWRTMESRGRALIDAAGPPLTAVITSRDVTEAVLAETALAQSVETTNAIIDSAVDVIVLINSDLNIIEISPAAENVLGRTPSSRRGGFVLEFMHPDDRSTARTALRNAFDEDGFVNFRARMLHTDGRTVIVEVRGRTLRDALGPPTRLVFIARDVTEAVDADAALARSLDKINAIFYAAADSIIVVDRNLVIREASPGHHRLSGYPIEARLGHDSLEYVHSGDRSLFASSLERLFSQRTDQVTNFRFRSRHADGQWLMMETRARLVQEFEDTVPRAVLVTRDISETVARDDALENAKSEAERANRAKSDFMSRMSHELRTPLNSVLGFAQILQMESNSAADVEIGDQIYRSGRHLLNLINEVLEISRIESGAIAVSLETIALDDVIDECVDIVRPQASAMNVNIVKLTNECHSVIADQNRLRQVVINLLSNAIKYNSDGGSVLLTCELRNEFLRFCVSDTGNGIAPELIDRLFIPFDRLGAENSGIDGTGLGLAVSKSLAEAMGGSLTLVTSSEYGCTFALELRTS